LLTKKDELSEKAEAIAWSVLQSLRSDYSAEDFDRYLKDAEKIALKRLDTFKVLLKSVTNVSQEQLAAFIDFLIDFQLSP
jgi:hypothetical protein